MARKITLSEQQLNKVIKNILEQEIGDDETLFDIEDLDVIDTEEVEDEVEQILTPEEIMGLMEEQIHQLQDRVQYSEELLADVLEYTEYLNTDLEQAADLDLRKSKHKLRALQTRAGREIFWLKSRRL